MKSSIFASLDIYQFQKNKFVYNLAYIFYSKMILSIINGELIMKKLNKCVILLAALVSTNVLAASTQDLTFDLSNKDTTDAKTPYFHCTVEKDPSILIGTKITMQAQDTTVKFNNNATQYTNLSSSDLNKYHFQVIKGDTQGNGTIHIAADRNDADIKCEKGVGNGTVVYPK